MVTERLRCQEEIHSKLDRVLSLDFEDIHIEVCDEDYRVADTGRINFELTLGVMELRAKCVANISDEEAEGDNIARGKGSQIRESQKRRRFNRSGARADQATTGQYYFLHHRNRSSDMVLIR